MQGYFVEHSLEGLLRGDSKARAEFYRYMREAGAFSANDIRRLENMNNIDGGDEYLQPSNLAPIGFFTKEKHDDVLNLGERHNETGHAKELRAQLQVRNRKLTRMKYKSLFREMLKEIGEAQASVVLPVLDDELKRSSIVGLEESLKDMQRKITDIGYTKLRGALLSLGTEVATDVIAELDKKEVDYSHAFA